MITSMSNGQMKNIQQLMKKAKARRDSGLFVVEGIKMINRVNRTLLDDLEKVYDSIK